MRAFVVLWRVTGRTVFMCVSETLFRDRVCLSFSPPVLNQVIRDARLRGKRPREGYSVREADDWATSAMQHFHSEPGQTLAQKRKRVKQCTVTLPRLTSLDSLLILQHAMYSATG